MLFRSIPDDRFLSFIHPTSLISKSVEIGSGNIILANVVLNCNVKMGKFNTMHTGSFIAHDTIIGNNNFIAAHTCIGSNIEIEDGNFFGLNCSVRNFVKIGRNNIVGMASNVIKKIDNNTIVIGNPAKILKYKFNL